MAVALLLWVVEAMSLVGWRVLFWRAMTFAAPKSTYFMTPLWSRRMSVERDQYLGSTKVSMGLKAYFLA